MKAMHRATLFLACCAWAVSVVADGSSQVTVTASGDDHKAALENAFSEAAQRHSGTSVFNFAQEGPEGFSRNVSTYSGAMVSSYEVTDERELEGGQVEVTLKAVMADTAGDFGLDASEQFQEQVKEVANIDALTQQHEAQRELFESLLGSRDQILQQGYAFSLEGYDVTGVSGDGVRGHFVVDVIVNQAFWEAVFDLARSTEALSRDTVAFGPFSENDSGRPTTEESGYEVSRDHLDLIRNAFMPMHIFVGVPSSNQYMSGSDAIGAHRFEGDEPPYAKVYAMANGLMAGDTVRLSDGDDGPSEFSLGGRYVESAKELPIIRDRSSLSCGEHRSSMSDKILAAFCGERFSVKVPFEVDSQDELQKLMDRGVFVARPL